MHVLNQNTKHSECENIHFFPKESFKCGGIRNGSIFSYLTCYLIRFEKRHLLLHLEVVANFLELDLSEKKLYLDTKRRPHSNEFEHELFIYSKEYYNGMRKRHLWTVRLNKMDYWHIPGKINRPFYWHQKVPRNCKKRSVNKHYS
ncbi:hypothetical protein TNIN_435521 [Trichonephila inaurata madagascariensis]|uniref:Uncharacterized protein n=1 Tax=Trichonephila inaurata madagascariensis TaxID=2747483 RepID=A0A8X6YWD6_9ARAC|nr:hypothetical protein TNIN_435521 [Trichonephila inaurata madagascariensis]